MIATDTEGFTELAMVGQDASAFENPSAAGRAPRTPVFFYPHDVQDQEASAREGRPIFKSVDYIQIMVPGDKTNILRRPVRIGNTPKHDNMRFPEQWAAYKQKREQRPEGTPLAAWPILSTAQVKELEYLNIFTVEQLADMPDSHVSKHTGLTKLKKLAKAFLSKAGSTKEISRLSAELDKRDEQLASLQAQMAEMAKELKALKKARLNVVSPPSALDNAEDDDYYDDDGDDAETANSFDDLDENLYGSDEPEDSDEAEEITLEDDDSGPQPDPEADVKPEVKKVQRKRKVRT